MAATTRWVCRGPRLDLLDGKVVLDRRGAREAEILKTMNELNTLAPK